MLDTFLDNEVISQAQYDKSLGDLTVKLGMEQENGEDRTDNGILILVQKEIYE